MNIPVKTMHALEQHVVSLGVCPKCHRKTLREAFSDKHFGRWMQCDVPCLHVYVLPPVEAAA